MTPGRYVSRTSPVHNLDPRTKILGVALLVATVFIIDSPFAQLALLGILLLFSICARLPARFVWHSILPIVPVLVLTFGLNAIATPGQPIRFAAREFQMVTYQGLLRGSLLATRLLCVILIASLLTLTTSPMELSDAMGKLLAPLQRLNLPIGELVLALTIALRFVPILFEEATRLYRAQIARGADFSGGFIRRIRCFFPLLIPLFISAFGRADKLATALEIRGFTAQRRRSTFRPLLFTIRDVYAILITGGIMALGGASQEICAAIFA